MNKLLTVCTTAEIELSAQNGVKSYNIYIQLFIFKFDCGVTGGKRYLIINGIYTINIYIYTLYIYIV